MDRQAALINELRALFATASRDDWVALLAETDCCFEPVLAPEEVAGHPHVVHRQLLQPSRDGALPTEIRFPVIVDQRTPRRRQPLREVTVEVVATGWGVG